MKKTLLILLTIIVLLGIGGYFYFNKTPAASQPEVLKPIGVVFRDFFPLGDTTTAPPEDNPIYTPPATSTPDEQTPSSRELLTQLSKFPVVGYGITEKEKEVVADPTLSVATTTTAKPPAIIKVPVIRYVEKATGHIFEREIPTGTETEISNTTIPGSQEVIVGKSTVIYRYIGTDGKEITSFAGILPIPESDGSLPVMKGTFLTPNIMSMSASPDLTKIFSLVSETAGVTGSISAFDGTSKTTPFLSRYHEWLGDWNSTDFITLTTKASGLAPGFAYLLDISHKNFSRLLGDIPGLTTSTSPDNKLVLYSVSGNKTFEMDLFDIASQQKKVVVKVSLPEKCVWSRASKWFICAVPEGILPAVYPDAWYQGKVNFSDSIWKTDVTANPVSNEVYNLFKEKRLSVDAVQLGLSADERYLYFINKTDGTLWQLELNQIN